MNAVADSKTYRDNRLKAGLDPDNMPKHIAVIMDGNGRWAKQQGFLTRVRGHEVGVEALRRITTASAELGLGFLTVLCLFNRKLEPTKSRSRCFDEYSNDRAREGITGASEE